MKYYIYCGKFFKFNFSKCQHLYQILLHSQTIERCRITAVVHHHRRRPNQRDKIVSVLSSKETTFWKQEKSQIEKTWVYIIYYKRTQKIEYLALNTRHLASTITTCHSSTQPTQHLPSNRQGILHKTLTCDNYNIKNGEDQVKSVESHGQIGKRVVGCC